MDGRSVAVVHSSTIGAAMGVLNKLSHRTTGQSGRPRASRPVGTYPIMHLSYHSPTGRKDEFGLLSKLTAVLRQRGPWSLVEALPEEGDPRRVQTVQCFMWHVRGSLPTRVSLRCSVPRLGATASTPLPWDASLADHVLFITGASCKGCLSSDLVFTSTRTRAIAATEALARNLLEQVELERKIYSPQRADRSR